MAQDYIPGTDIVASLKAWLESDATEIRMSPRDLVIPAAGPDAGGVEVLVPVSKRIICEPGARFIAGADLDNTMLTIRPAVSGLSIEWIGGHFDQTAQKNSTVIPYSSQYPPANPGMSQTTDALAISGDVPGVVGSCFESIVVRGVTGFAGSRWETSGGDSTIGIKSGRNIVVQDCHVQGSRDLAFYISGHADHLQDKSSVTVSHCSADWCLGGISLKRWLDNCTVSFNAFAKTIFPIGIAYNSDRAIRHGAIHHNIAETAFRMIDLDYAQRFTVYQNSFTNAIARMADGKPPSSGPFAGPAEMIRLNNAYKCEASENELNGGKRSTVMVNIVGTEARHNFVARNRADVASVVALDNGADGNVLFDNRV